MNENRISLEFTGAEKAQAIAAFNTFIGLVMPKLVTISNEDKKRLSKIGDDSIPFNEKVAQYVASNPEFVPMFYSADEFLTDFSLFRDLREILRLGEQLIDNMEGTSMLAGSEADRFARAYYAAVGQAAKMGVPNAQAIYDDLSERYEAQRSNRPKKTPTE